MIAPVHNRAVVDKDLGHYSAQKEGHRPGSRRPSKPATGIRRRHPRLRFVPKALSGSDQTRSQEVLLPGESSRRGIMSPFFGESGEGGTVAISAAASFGP